MDRTQDDLEQDVSKSQELDGLESDGSVWEVILFALLFVLVFSAVARV